MKIPITHPETRAGRAEEGEFIVVESPEGHLLAGEVEIVWTRNNELYLEFRAAESVDSIIIGRMELDGTTLQTGIWRES